MKVSNLKFIIKEEVVNVLKEYDEDVDWDLFEMRNEILRDTIQEFIDKRERNQPQSWALIKFPRLKKIWEDYMRTGFVRDEKGLEEIVNRMTRNVLKLDVNTLLAGHDTYLPTEELEDYGLTEEDLNTDEFDTFITDPKTGQWRISDYGLKPLYDLLEKLRKARTAEEKVPIIDQMLNVVHQRSDLASWFVEGGSSALSQLSGTDD